MAKNILEETLEGKRLSTIDALSLLESEDWTTLVHYAQKRRFQLHPKKEVSFTAFRIINYTNYCDIDCSFCSFKDDVESDRGYTLSLEQIKDKAIEAQKKGIDQIFFQGGVNPKLPLDYYTQAFEMLSQEFNMDIRGLSPIEIYRLAEKENMSVAELLVILKQAGLTSVPGAGAEILTENMRDQLSPKKLSGKDWCEVMGEAHKQNLPGSSNIVFGSTETNKDIMEHFELIRDQQDKTQGFLSFIPWTFQPQTKKFTVKYVQGHEYLKMVALARLYFDNIPNIEVSIMVLGQRLAEMGLHAGANDISSIVIEENVLKSFGLRDVPGAQKFIKNAGFAPVQRDMNYNLV